VSAAVPRLPGTMELKRELAVPISREAEDLLEQLARYGIYGSTAEEVAARFVEERLRAFVPAPMLIEPAFAGRLWRRPARRRS
jgi:hypothetical protein